MYELLVLSLLMHFPLHAYLIAKIISPWETISRGTLSTLLARLEKEGMIAGADSAAVPFPGERPSRALQITAEGRKRFYQLMMDTSSSSSTYQKLFHIKSQHLEFLAPEEQLYLVNHYLAYAGESIAKLKKQISAFTEDAVPAAGSPGAQFHSTTVDLLNVRLEAKALDLAWAMRLRDVVLALKEEQK